MRRTHVDNRFVPGDHWRECDVCGFDYRRSELMERWDRLLVCKEDYEERHPKDILTPVTHEQPFKDD